MARTTGERRPTIKGRHRSYVAHVGHDFLCAVDDAVLLTLGSES